MGHRGYVVRRREVDEGAPGGVPVRLRRFDPDRWPGADVRARHGAWLAAREAWEAEHGDWDGSLAELLASFDLVPPEPFDWSLI
jgi:hypothetical protein